MTIMTAADAQEYFADTFCRSTSTTYLPIEPIGEPDEILSGTIFSFTVEHTQFGRCAARLYCGLAHHLGGRLWLQETQSLMRLNAAQHPALPRVREGLFRDDDAVGLVVSDAGEALSLDDTASLRRVPAEAFRYFCLAADALGTLHGHGLIHRDIWRGAFELSVDREGPSEKNNLCLSGFEMSAFAASLTDPVWRTTPQDRERLRLYHARGGEARHACRAPEVGSPDAPVESMGLSYRSDVFSLGVCGYEWFVDALPVAGQPSDGGASVPFIEQLDAGIVKATHLPEALRDLLRRMLRQSPRTRPTATEVVNQLAAIADDVETAFTQQVEQPLLVTVAPRTLAQHVQLESWKRDLPSDEQILMDQLKARLEADLVRCLLIHEPRGAEGYVQGGDRAVQRESVWVLIGKEAVVFCQPFRTPRGLGGSSQQLDWALHVSYVVDRSREELSRIAVNLSRRRLLGVRVVHAARSAELHPREAKGRHPSWTPLLEAVRLPMVDRRWETPFRRGFQWWLDVQRAMLETRMYPCQRETWDASKARLVSEEEHDEIWTETDHLRHLVASMRPKRPELGNFFGTLRERDLGEEVTWHEDVRGVPDKRPVKDAHARVRRISAHAVELEWVRGPWPPRQKVWLRPASDISSDILLQRQRQATTALFGMPHLAQALYQPTSIRASRKTWDNAPGLLEGYARKIVKDMLAHFPFYAVQGPPGTGKTAVVAHAVAAYVAAKPGARVLVSAQSHFALDELAERILALVGRDVAGGAMAVRITGEYGLEQVRPSMKAYLDVAQARRRVERIVKRAPATRPEWSPEMNRQLQAIGGEWRRAVEKSEWEIQDRIWRGANLVFATCGTCTEKMLGHADELDSFDWVVVEESAKAWPAELVMPLVLGHRWTLIGDHQQLPPFGDLKIRELYETCLRSTDPGLQALVDDREPFVATLELFRHLFDDLPVPQRSARTFAEVDATAANRSRAWPVDRLNQQYRMHDDIRRIVGQVFYPMFPYESAEAIRETPPTHAMREPDCLRGRAIAWLDTKGLASCRYESGQWRNEGEAGVVASLVKKLLSQVERTASDIHSTPALIVLSPYHQQNVLIRQHLSSPQGELVQTTDAFQGREADIVVVSLVRTNTESKESPFRRIGHLASPQRANVLLSRARKLLIIVGDFEHFRATVETPWPAICEIVRELQGHVVLKADAWEAVR